LNSFLVLPPDPSRVKVIRVVGSEVFISANDEGSQGTVYDIGTFNALRTYTEFATFTQTISGDFVYSARWDEATLTIHTVKKFTKDGLLLSQNQVIKDSEVSGYGLFASKSYVIRHLYLVAYVFDKETLALVKTLHKSQSSCAALESSDILYCTYKSLHFSATNITQDIKQSDLVPLTDFTPTYERLFKLTNSRVLSYYYSNSNELVMFEMELKNRKVMEIKRSNLGCLTVGDNTTHFACLTDSMRKVCLYKKPDLGLLTCQNGTNMASVNISYSRVILYATRRLSTSRRVWIRKN
jgi:hypothetical protein